MSLTDTPQPLIKRQGAPRDIQRRITGKVRTAIDAMVWQGLKRPEAAAVAGLHDNSLYIAMRKPDVKAYYLEQCEVLRLSGRARRIHRMTELSEQDDNKAAAVSALNSLDRVEDQQLMAATQRQSPGVTIIIESAAHMPHVVADAAKPLIEHEVVPVDEHERHPRRTRE